MKMTAEPEISPTDIAIVGMAGRFPGARSIDEYWRLLAGGVEGIVTYTEEELLARGVPASLLSDPNYVKAGGPLEGFDQFDAGFFGVSPKDAAIMDPQHRVFYECAWEALEQAGHITQGEGRFTGSIGVFAGCGMNAYFVYNVLPNPELLRGLGLFLLRHTGNDRDFLPTGVSYKLNLQGPSVAVQTACSTSLVAVHMACQSLLSRECDMALAGGVTIQVPHGHGYLYREGEVLSPDGHCRPFDARATGTVITNGVGAVVLRRLEDALADGDPIHAVIKGSAINNDGSEKVGFLAPSVQGHARAVVEALGVAGFSAEDISYVETHGTGTAVGDPIEIAALTEAYRQTTDKVNFCPLGSVKSNIGHLDTAAGVAGLIKVVEAIKHGQLPPTLHFQKPNPAANLESSPFFVNTQLREWTPASGVRRAGISSLGVGGTNAHVIVEEAPLLEPTTEAEPWQLLTLSAKTPSALDAMTARLADHLESQAELNFADVAHTLQVARTPFPCRRVVAAKDAADAVRVLRERDSKQLWSGKASGVEPSVVFMFPGGGTQYPNMGRGLYETESVFREAVDRCLAILEGELDFDLRALLFPAAGAEEAAAAELRGVTASICGIFTVSYAMAQLWMSRGVEPAAMTGHSLGEYVAACLAGVVSLEDALKIVVLRGRLLERTPSAEMMSVPLPEDEVLELLRTPELNELDLAAVNGPSLCLVSGKSHLLDVLAERLSARELTCRRLHIAAASHCRLLDPILDEFRRGISQVRLSEPVRPYVSNVTGTWIRPQDATNPDYWVRHFRHCVRFSQGLAELLREPGRVLLEVGPGQALCSLARQQGTGALGIVNSLRHPEEKISDRACFLGAVGRLWIAGYRPDWLAFRRDDELRAKVVLPTYPFERQRYWLEPVKASEVTERASAVLRKHPSLESWPTKVGFRRTLVPQPAPARASTPQKWLVFVDESGVGKELVRRLEAQGHQVVSVREGDAFHRFGDKDFALPPEDASAYRNLLVELAATGRLPDRVAHLWLLTASEKFRPGSSFFHHCQERGFYSLLFLVQAAADHALPSLHIDLIANRLFRVGSEDVVQAAKATAPGALRVICREFKGITGRTVDVEFTPTATGWLLKRTSQPTAQLGELLLSELCAPATEGTVAYRAGERHEQVFEAVPLPEPSGGPAALREQGVYLITGGLGGLGLTLAEHLAAKYRAKLVLVGRTALPPRAQWGDWLASHTDLDPTSRRLRRIQAMEARGAEVLCVAADVANIEAMRRALGEVKSRFGALHGVLHAAGTVEDGLALTKTAEQIENVFGPKIHGTLVLSELLAGEPLDFFVLFSSTSALLAPPGQLEYTAANCFLDAFAESPAGTALKALSVNWGVWKEAGLGRETMQRLRGHSEDRRPRLRPHHGLLGEVLVDRGGLVECRAELDAKAVWMLDEHRMNSGRAVLPGTGYFELLHAALLEQRHGEVGPMEVRDLSFFAPLAVDDEMPLEIRVRLEQGKAKDTFQCHVESRRTDSASWTAHATGVLGPLTDPASKQLDLGAARARCPRRLVGDGGVGDGALRLRQSALLKFGARWQVMEQARFGSQEAVADLVLPAAFGSDVDSFALHPALLDIATGFALPLIDGYAESDAVYVPLGYGAVRVYGRLPARIVSHVRSAPGNQVERETARFDVTLTDADGKVLVEIEQFTVRKIAKAAAFASEAQGAGATATRSQLSAGEKLFLESFESGIEGAEGTEVLERVLASGLGPRVVLSPVELDALLARTDEAARAMHALASAVKFDRPQLQSQYEEPRDEVERTLAKFWEDLLGVDQVGIHDDFFELGGHSLVAARVFAKVKQTWDVEYPLSALFEAPTIAKMAAKLRDELHVSGAAQTADGAASGPQRRFRHLVPMSPEAAALLSGEAPVDNGRRPFFLVAGMFGNVLNLRYLASRLGRENPIIAVQARGLHGEDKPHDTFEDMARDYLEEIRQVQPHGPYFLGGFSGGGLSAFEMAHQLRDVGEQIGVLIMLDSIPPRLPPINNKDRIMVHLLRLRQSGPRYVTDWAKRRVEWEMRRFKNREERAATPAEFRSAEIEAAFRAACAVYQPRVYDGPVHLFRPPLDKQYVVGPNRVLNAQRELVDDVNHWNQYITGGIAVHVVTGDHDSMMLEPYVRVLASEMRTVLDDAHGGVDAREKPLEGEAARRDGAAVPSSASPEGDSAPSQVQVAAGTRTGRPAIEA
jgi:acyl transferase domain-containing protein/thioesterase domain-containing protein